MFNAVLQEFLKFGLLTTCVVGVMLYVFATKPEFIYDIISKVSGRFAWAGTSFRKQQVASGIRSKIMRASKDLSKESDEILTYDLKVEWVSESDRDSFVQANQVIVRMSQSNNPQRNMVYAVREFISHGFMPEARRYVDGKILAAADLAVTRKLLLRLPDNVADYFIDNFLIPELAQDEDLRGLLERVIRLDQTGMLVPVMVGEFVRAGRRLYGEPPDPRLVAESKDFLRFLHALATREGDMVDLEFNGTHIKTAIGYAAKGETLTKYGTRRHLQRIFSGLDRGLRTIYIFGYGKNTDIAKIIAAAAQEADLRISSIKESAYTHVFSDRRRIDGICIRIDTEAVA